MKRATILAVALAVTAGASVRSEVTDLFPDDTAYVVRLNVKAVVAQPTVLGDAKSIKSAMGEAAKVMESCGIDPIRDLTQATLAVGGNASGRTAVVLIEGTFDPTKIRARLAQLATERKTEIEARSNGVFQWTLPADKTPAAGGMSLPNRFYFSVIDEKLAAWAIDEAAINDAIDKKAGRKRGTPSKAVSDLLGQAKADRALAVVAVPPPGALGRSPAAGMSHLVGSVRATDAINLDLICTTKDAKSARALAEYIGDGVASIKELAVLVATQSKNVTPAQQAMLREFFDTIKTTATPTGVSVTSVLSKEFLEKNAKK